MHFEISKEDKKSARQPHELFLINLVFNHILLFIAFLGMINEFPFLITLIPLISVSILSYTIYRAKSSKNNDSWFAMCHWQLCAKRSRVFLIMLSILAGILLLGWIGYTFIGMQKVAVLAMSGGLGLLPTMVTVLALIIMESDALHQAGEGKIADWVVEKHPNNSIRIIAD